jgi:hypothetical protein
MTALTRLKIAERNLIQIDHAQQCKHLMVSLLVLSDTCSETTFQKTEGDVSRGPGRND